jgi:flagellar export protein FliJ
MEKDLSTLVRLKKWVVDEEQRALAELLGQIADIENRQKLLQEHVKSEQEAAAADPEGLGFAYGSFANSVIQIRAQFEKALQDLEQQVLTQREKIAEAYRDFKTVEQLQKNREKRAQIEQDRKDQMLMDEMAATTHRRTHE